MPFVVVLVLRGKKYMAQRKIVTYVAGLSKLTEISAY